VKLPEAEVALIHYVCLFGAFVGRLQDARYYIYSTTVQQTNFLADMNQRNAPETAVFPLRVLAIDISAYLKL